MAVFTATLSQTAFLFLFIILGYLLAKWKCVPDNAPTVLSKLENTVFIPALVLGTFMSNFTAEKLTETSELLLSSLVMALIAIAISLLLVRICSKDKYEQSIFAYGLCFSNFGFVGNAVVSALFPELFMDYLVFTLPLWTLIYLWGVPVLLIGGTEKPGFVGRLKNFVNPMFICTILGMVIGLTGIPVPQFIQSAATAAGNCMSPAAMLLTGMTIAKFDLRQVLGIKRVYVVTALRLLVYPLAFIAVAAVVPLPRTFTICAVSALAMPLGMNTIIVPGALGKDTRVASGMALVSHILCCLTIPLIFMIFDRMV